MHWKVSCTFLLYFASVSLMASSRASLRILRLTFIGQFWSHSDESSAGIGLVAGDMLSLIFRVSEATGCYCYESELGSD